MPNARALLKAALLTLSIFITIVPANVVAQEAQADNPQSAELNPWALLLGWELQVIGHESGHALTALLTGGRVISFRPYPTFCGGLLAGGCVEYVGGNHVLVTAAGSMTSNLIFLAVTPFYFSLPEGFGKQTIQGMLFWQMTDFFLYTMIDAFKYGGDWMSFSEQTGIPGLLLIPVAILDVWALYQYYQYWYGKEELGRTDIQYQIKRSYGF